MGAIKLTERQRAALRRLAQRDHVRHGAETGTEIAAALWSFFTSLEQGQRACKQLAARGFAERLGTGPTGAATWIATDAGRAYIDATTPTGAGRDDG
jgi:hypothetical protein